MVEFVVAQGKANAVRALPSQRAEIGATVPRGSGLIIIPALLAAGCCSRSSYSRGTSSSQSRWLACAHLTASRTRTFLVCFSSSRHRRSSTAVVRTGRNTLFPRVTASLSDPLVGGHALVCVPSVPRRVTRG
eukprot:5091047-Prymnesium_polylepis.1